LDELAVRTGPDDDRLVDARRADALVDLCAGYLAGGITGLRAPTSGTRLVIDVPYAALLDNPLFDNPFTGGPLTGPPLAVDLLASSALAGPAADGGSPRPGGGCPGGAQCRLAGEGSADEGSAGVGITDPGGSAAGGIDCPSGSAPPTVHGEPIGRVAFERLSCDTELVRLVTYPRTGAVADLGRTSRLPDTRLRRAIEIRDGHR
jgi:hypothetical protein